MYLNLIFRNISDIKHMENNNKHSFTYCLVQEVKYHQCSWSFLCTTPVRVPSSPDDCLWHTHSYSFTAFSQLRYVLGVQQSDSTVHILLFFFFFFLIFIYLAAPGLGCGIQDLFPWPGIEPRPLQWEHRVLATGPPGQSPVTHILLLHFCSRSKEHIL